MRFAAPSKNADANASDWSSSVNRPVDHPATHDEQTDPNADDNNDHNQIAARSGVKMVIGRDFRKKASTRLSKRFQTLRDAPYRKRSYVLEKPVTYVEFVKKPVLDNDNATVQDAESDAKPQEATTNHVNNVETTTTVTPKRTSLVSAKRKPIPTSK